MPNHDPDLAMQEMDELLAWRAERLVEADTTSIHIDGDYLDPGWDYYKRATEPQPVSINDSLWLNAVLRRPFGPDAIGHHAVCWNCWEPLLYFADDAGVPGWEHVTRHGELHSHRPEPYPGAEG